MTREIDRRVPLAGAVNCRDLGGYAGSGGRTIRWRRLYRSDSFAELTPADVELVRELGLRTVFDLRHEAERAQKPNRGLDATEAVLHAIGFLPYGAADLFRGATDGSLGLDAVGPAMREAYRRFVSDSAPTYATLLDVLCREEAYPALVHCTSGRDRTGFAAAVVLLALGVERETIVEDYLLTDRYRRDQSFLFGPQADPVVLEALSRARREYLEAAFAAIDERHGSEAAYLERALGLDAAKRARLGALLLEDRPSGLAERPSRA